MVRATQQEVARLAGVTRATVSYVLNGRAEELHISDAVVERVREAAARVGYIGSHAARTLVSGKSYTIGLYSPLGGEGGRSVFWSQFAEGVQIEALRSGYSVLLNAAAADRREQMLRHMHEGRIDGLVFVGHLSRDEIEPWPRTVPAPVVIEFTGKERLPRVTLDSRPAYDEAARRLRAAGHRRVLWVQPADTVDRERRFTAARLACEEAGLQIDRARLPGGFVPGESTPAEIERWAAALAEVIPPAGSRHTALLCWNDSIAFGAYALLRQRGLRVPEDLSVVGFDDFFAEAALPALSTVRHELRTLGAVATRLLLRVVSGELTASAAASAVQSVSATFADRASIGRPRAR